MQYCCSGPFSTMHGDTEMNKIQFEQDSNSPKQQYHNSYVALQDGTVMVREPEESRYDLGHRAREANSQLH